MQLHVLSFSAVSCLWSFLGNRGNSGSDNIGNKKKFNVWLKSDVFSRFSDVLWIPSINSKVNIIDEKYLKMADVEWSVDDKVANFVNNNKDNGAEFEYFLP